MFDDRDLIAVIGPQVFGLIFYYIISEPFIIVIAILWASYYSNS